MNDLFDKTLISDLGASYSKVGASFKLWAPNADSVAVKLFSGDNFILYPMNEVQKGLFSLFIDGDLLNREYLYVIKRKNEAIETLDPYGKGVSFNSLRSAIVDTESIKNINRIKPTNVINNPVDSLIYELNIRDFTEDKNTNIKNKGTYLGLVEENAKTKKGHPAGLDYLKLLGITHVQLQPVCDFASIDDDYTKYNWGYDPLSYFALEGVYAFGKKCPMARLKEFREMVDILHKNNIRVIMDVVFNHVYKYEDSSLEKCAPDYYFRKTKEGKIANASGCGNDLASEKPMVRHLILESIRYFTETFDIDGFRFDLMGLIDKTTILEAYNLVKSVKPDALFYGEGWNMGDELSFKDKTCSENAFILPEIGFFNDTYRDIVKGPTFDLKEKGFASGNPDYKYGLDYALHGSVCKLSYDPKFANANQSINFIECHDNHTMFDKLLISNADESEKQILNRINFANGILLLSFGVPFIHMGQEIGLTKHGFGNTYNMPKINNMDYHLLDERWAMVESFIYYKELRFKYLKIIYQNYDKDILNNIYDIKHLDNGVYELDYSSKNKKHIPDVIILLNTTKSKHYIELPGYYSSQPEISKNQQFAKRICIIPSSIEVLFNSIRHN